MLVSGASNYPTWITVLELIFTFVLVPVSVYQILSRFLLVDSPADRGRFFVYSLGFGPALLAWLLIMFLWAAPGLPHWSYIAAVNVVFLLPMIFLWREFVSLPGLVTLGFGKFLKSLWTDKLQLFFYLGCFVLLVVLFLSCLTSPFIHHDALEYVVLAKMAYLQKTISFYPIMSGEHSGGFLAPFTHPLGYVGSFTWWYFIKGGVKSFGLIRIMAPLYIFYTFLLVVSCLYRVNKRSAALAAALLLATPAYLHTGVTHGIDALRLYTFFLFFIFLADWVVHRTWRYAVVAGCFLGICLYSHSISIIAIPMFLFIVAITKSRVRHKLFSGLLILVVGLLFVLVRYLINLHVVGAVILDGAPLTKLPLFHHQLHIDVAQHISSRAAMWINGFLRLFYSVLWFGFAYLFFLFGLLLLRRNSMKKLMRFIEFDRFEESVVFIITLVGLLYLAGVMLTLCFGVTDFIYSSRYIMSAGPIFAFAAAVFVTRFIQQFSLAWQRVFWLIIFVAVGSIGLVTLIFMPIYTSVGNDFAKGQATSPTIKVIAAYNAVAKHHHAYLLCFEGGQQAYYASTPFLFRSDPRMRPVYATMNKEKALKTLLSLGVNYVSIPNSAEGYVNYSVLSGVLGDPRLSYLVFQDRGAKLFYLLSSPLPLTMQPVLVKNPSFISKRGQLSGWMGSWQPSQQGVLIKNDSFYTRSLSKLSQSAGMALTPGARYQVRLTLRGKGGLTLYLNGYRSGSRFYQAKVWSMVLLGKPTDRVRTFQFYVPVNERTDQSAGLYRLQFVLRGQGQVNFKQIALNKINYKEAVGDFGLKQWVRPVLHQVVKHPAVSPHRVVEQSESQYTVRQHQTTVHHSLHHQVVSELVGLHQSEHALHHQLMARSADLHEQISLLRHQVMMKRVDLHRQMYTLHHQLLVKRADLRNQAYVFRRKLYAFRHKLYVARHQVRLEYDDVLHVYTILHHLLYLTIINTASRLSSHLP